MLNWEEKFTFNLISFSKPDFTACVIVIYYLPTMMQSNLPPGTSVMPLEKIAVIGRSSTYYAQVSLMSQFELASDLGGSFCLFLALCCQRVLLCTWHSLKSHTGRMA